MTYTGPVPPVARSDKLKFWLSRVKLQAKDFFRRPAGNNSTFGKVSQLTGAVSVLIGLYLVYPPLAFLVGGVACVIAGEKL